MEKTLNVVRTANEVGKNLFDGGQIASRQEGKTPNSVGRREFDLCVVTGTVDRCDAEVTVTLERNMIVIKAVTMGAGDTLGMDFTIQLLAEDVTEERLSKHLYYYMSELNFY